METDEAGLSVFSCRGDEDSLYDCVESRNMCGTGVGAGVVCSSIGNHNHIVSKLLISNCPIDGSAVHLTKTGQLVKQGLEIQTEDYCLAEHWESGFAKYDYVGVLTCDKCHQDVCW